jgi:hypothetical protein
MSGGLGCFLGVAHSAHNVQWTPLYAHVAHPNPERRCLERDDRFVDMHQI